MTVCGPCSLEHHWVCNRTALVACDCEHESHEHKPEPPRSILGERE